MTDAQTIFTILYGLYFAVTVTLTGKFQPFDTPSVWVYGLKRRALMRLIVSFVLLNILPLAYFVCVLNWLSRVTNFPFSNFWSMFGSVLGLLMFSLAGFGFYRIYFGIMLINRKNNFIFYDSELPKPLVDELKQRDRSQSKCLPHLVPGIQWSLVTTLCGYFLISLIFHIV